jgi:hypothetical protein
VPASCTKKKKKQDGAAGTVMTGSAFNGTAASSCTLPPQVVFTVLATSDRERTGAAARKGSCCLFLSQQLSPVAAADQHADLSAGYTGVGIVSQAAEKAEGEKSFLQLLYIAKKRPPQRA